MVQQSLMTFLFSSKGRVSRMQYNVYFMLPFIMVNYMLMELPKWFQHDLELMFKISLITGILSLIVLWPFLAMTNKRFHDRNASGWRHAFYFLISMAGMFVISQGVNFTINPAAMTFAYTVTNQIFSIIGAALVALPMIAMIVDLCVLKGTTGPNKYGEDPLEINE